jgi:hypothetical protein
MKISRIPPTQKSPGRSMERRLVSWSKRFDDPIPLPDGRVLVTLRDAASFITELPKKEADLPEWQPAIEALMLAVGTFGPTMFARFSVMQALNRPQNCLAATHLKHGRATK